jgi:hypothetical protein
MTEGGERLGFAFEPRDALGIQAERHRQPFDRDVAVEPGIARAIHLAQPAFAEFPEDLVRADLWAHHEVLVRSATARPRHSSRCPPTRAEAGPPAPICAVTS